MEEINPSFTDTDVALVIGESLLLTSPSAHCQCNTRFGINLWSAVINNACRCQ